MRVEIEIAEPTFKLKEDEELVCRGFGWNGFGGKISPKGIKCTTYSVETGLWGLIRTGKPAGKNGVLYFEVVSKKIEPEMPSELDGYELQYVGRGDEYTRIMGRRFAYLEKGVWSIHPFPLNRFHKSNPNVEIALAIEKSPPVINHEIEGRLKRLESIVLNSGKGSV